MMKKRIAALLLAALFLFSAAACRRTYDDNDPQNPSGQTPEPLPPEAPPVPEPPDPLPEPEPPAAPTVNPDIDLGKLSGLSTESKDWGPGGPKDDKNRSAGALQYNKLYGKYNAVFLEEESEKVYLTFDEGYEFGFTGRILDTLKEKGVKAVFFVTQNFAKTEPELMKRMIAEGHVVGNHSWTHGKYSSFTAEEVRSDCMKLHDYVKENFDYEMQLFRFPSGNFSELSLGVLQEMGYRSVFWSFAYKDWITDQQPNPAESLPKIVDSACPGMIYLLHAVSETNTEILGDVIDQVKEKGFEWGDPAELCR